MLPPPTWPWPVAQQIAQGIDWKEIVSMVVAALTAAYVTWQKLKEKKERKSYGLKGNPLLCKDHEERLRGIEKDVGEMKVSTERDLGEIKGDIKAIKVRIGLPID